MNGMGRRLGIRKDRLLLALYDTPISATDIELAEGPVVADYLKDLGVLDDGDERPGILRAVKGMGEDVVTRLAREKRPAYRGRAQVVFADVSESGGVTECHASSECYDVSP